MATFLSFVRKDRFTRLWSPVLHNFQTASERICAKGLFGIFTLVPLSRVAALKIIRLINPNKRCPFNKWVTHRSPRNNLTSSLAFCKLVSSIILFASETVFAILPVSKYVKRGFFRIGSIRSGNTLNDKEDLRKPTSKMMEHNSSSLIIRFVLSRSRKTKSFSSPHWASRQHTSLTASTSHSRFSNEYRGSMRTDRCGARRRFKIL